ncbi:MAG TPA: MFS transporter, partial [Mycobacteriales bacterium]|nr:MFS transporter [Mycobacteriales bacterium]
MAAIRGRSAPSWALATVCAVLFLTFLDNTIVSVILGDVDLDLHAGVTQLQWVVDGYALVFAALMLAGGSLGDLLGRKKVMLGGIVVFCVGSVVCAGADSVAMLIGGRVVMGVGAAACEPGTLSVLRHLFPDPRPRARALGAWSAVSGLALALGPVIGGALDGYSGWRSVFWFNVGFGVLALVAAAVTVPETSDPQGRRLDALGLGSGAAALAVVTFAIIEGETVGYATWWIPLLFAVGIAAGAGFVLAERRVADPVLDLRFFRDRAFTGPNAVVCVTYFGIFAIFFLVALYLQLVVGRSGYQIALTFVPMMVVMVGGSALTGRWVAAAGPRLPMTVGCALAAAGTLLTDSYLSRTVGTGTLAWTLAIAGAGFGLVLVPVTSTVLAVVPAARSGMAASATNTSRQLGAVFGVAVLGALVYGELASGIGSTLSRLGVPSRFNDGVIASVTHGTIPANPAPNVAHVNPLQFAEQVIDAAYRSFGSGMHVALVLAGALLAASGVL